MGDAGGGGLAAHSGSSMPLPVALIGGGAIARVIARELVDTHPEVRLVGALDIDPAGARERGFAPEVPLVDSLEALLARGPAFVAECAGHAGLTQHGPGVLRAGLDLVVASVGALADARLEALLRDAAVVGGARMRIPSGAIGALDALASARVGGLERVSYVGRKPPLAWRGTRAEALADLDRVVTATRLFEGSAREAALAYPQNANVCAAVGLAGLGLDETRVELYADPEARGNEHRLQAAGAFGELRFEVVGRPLAGNPKTSSLAAYSLIKALIAPARAIAVG